jgi:hypothetical protein
LNEPHQKRQALSLWSTKSAFYTRCDKKHDEAVKYITEVLIWRKSFGANGLFLISFMADDKYAKEVFCKDLISIEKEEFFQNILSRGGYFLRNKDKNEVPIRK